MLSLKQIQDVCLIHGQHKRCRYLCQDENDRSKWQCAKKTTEKQEIDDECNIFIRDITNKGLPLNKQGVPLGDNCDGYPPMNHIEQGYDKD